MEACMAQTGNVTAPAIELKTYRVEDIGKMLGIGRTSAYNLCKEGHFRIVRIGTTIRISKKSFDEWLNSIDL
jgi:excisionase family DNA binding protein